MTTHNAEEWDKRYREGSTGWDLGTVSPPLQSYFDKLREKHLKILIPGCGNAYEAGYLHARGFTEVYLLDWSRTALDRFAEKYPDFPREHLICDDFFAHEGSYDLIIEQTFFCAIPPAQRGQYAKHMAALLKSGGILAGLMFNIPLNEDHPPYGGDKAEYLEYFEGLFEVIQFDKATKSIEPRLGNELFIELRKM